MTTPRQLWRLEKVVIRDVLGFQGEKEFAFQGGLQVIEAPNHTGKTSLTMALLWGMTGVIPNLPRINKQSFRLTNKHAGENAKPLVSVVLSHDDGRRMALHRAYRSRPDLDADLTVEVDDKKYTGHQAQETIFTELGLKPGSLEGCGVVLQNQRLVLITGKESDISDVISDMLGLYTLSQLVPALEAAGKDANELNKEVQQYIEVADPVAKWEERNQQLHDDFRELEDKANRPLPRVAGQPEGHGTSGTDRCGQTPKVTGPVCGGKHARRGRTIARGTSIHAQSQSGFRRTSQTTEPQSRT